MNNGMITAEFILLCGIQLFTIAFSTITFVHSFRRYLRTDPSEILLRKSIKYFTFIFLTIVCAGVFSLLTNFYYIATQDGVIAGYIFASVTTTILINVFLAWQFTTYLINPKRRPTKYIIGIYCIVGIILIWLFTPTITEVPPTPNVENRYLYIYLWAIFTFVWSIFTYDFFKSSLNATEKRDKYRFLCLGVSGVLGLLMFPMGMLGQTYSWVVTLCSTILLYLGYYFPKFFQRRLKA